MELEQTLRIILYVILIVAISLFLIINLIIGVKIINFINGLNLAKEKIESKISQKLELNRNNIRTGLGRVRIGGIASYLALEGINRFIFRFRK